MGQDKPPWVTDSLVFYYNMNLSHGYKNKTGKDFLVLTDNKILCKDFLKMYSETWDFFWKWNAICFIFRMASYNLNLFGRSSGKFVPISKTFYFLNSQIKW
jgi:hypothetical protein